MAEARFFVLTVQRVILYPLPARSGGVQATRFRQNIIQTGFALPAPGRAFFAGQMQGIHMFIIFNGARADIIRICPATKPAWVQARHVDLTLAMHDPLRQILATARPLGDADRRATALPEIAQARRWTQQRIGVWRMGNGAVDDALDATFAPDRHAFQGSFHPGADAVQFVGEQLILAVPFRIAAPIRPGFLGSLRLINADQARFLLLPVIGRWIGVAHYRHFTIRVDELLDRLGDNVMVLHIGDRHIGSDPLIDQPRITAPGIDHMLTGHGSLFCHDLPFAAGQLHNIQHAIPAFNLCTPIACALCQRIATARRVNMAVIQRPGSGKHAGRIDMGVDRLDLIGADNLHTEPDQLGRAFNLPEIIQFRPIGGKAQPTTAMPGDILPRHCFQFGI